MATVGMFDNSYFDNSKSDKTDYVQQLEGFVFEKKSDINIIYIFLYKCPEEHRF